jgi:hypothetical protein
MPAVPETETPPVCETLIQGFRPRVLCSESGEADPTTQFLHTVNKCTFFVLGFVESSSCIRSSSVKGTTPLIVTLQHSCFLPQSQEEEKGRGRRNHFCRTYHGIWHSAPFSLLVPNVVCKGIGAVLHPMVGHVPSMSGRSSGTRATSQQ